MKTKVELEKNRDVLLQSNYTFNVKMKRLMNSRTKILCLRTNRSVRLVLVAPSVKLGAFRWTDRFLFFFSLFWNDEV